MKKIENDKLEFGESYLVDTGFQWSPSGFDIAEYEHDKTLVSQSNGEDLFRSATINAIYELPFSED